MNKIDRRIVIVFTSIVILVLSFGLMKFLIAQKEEPNQRPPVVAKRYVKTENVKYTDIFSPVSASGRLASKAEIDIVAEASGKILASEIALKKGSQFKKGDLLFVIYPDEAQLALQSKKSQFLNTIANLLPDIHIDYPEYEETLRNFFNSIEIDKKLPEFPKFNTEKLKIFLASRNVISEYYGIQKDELQLQRHAVYAPFNGTYTQVNFEIGSYTSAGGRVARAIQTDQLELEVPLDKFDAKWVKAGDNVEVVSESRDLEWTGKVIRKSQFVDPSTQSQGLFIQVINDNKKPLLVGEYLTAQFNGSQVNGVMEIPRNAVFNSNDVFIVKDSRLVKKTIDIIKLNEKTLLFNGLEEGELLVLQPLINVLEGTMVETNREAFTMESKKKQGMAENKEAKSEKKSKK